MPPHCYFAITPRLPRVERAPSTFNLAVTFYHQLTANFFPAYGQDLIAGRGNLAVSSRLGNREVTARFPNREVTAFLHTVLAKNHVFNREVAITARLPRFLHTGPDLVYWCDDDARMTSFPIR